MESGERIVELLTEIKDGQQRQYEALKAYADELAKARDESRTWLQFRVIVPLFAILVVLTVLAIMNTR